MYSMMSLVYLIFPLIGSFLFLKLFKRVGFSGGMLLLCFAPLLGAVLPMIGQFAMAMANYGSLSGGMGFNGSMVGILTLSLIGNILGMLPLILLALMRWPVDGE